MRSTTPAHAQAALLAVLLVAACDSGEPEAPPGRDDEFAVGCDASTAVPIDSRGTYLLAAADDEVTSPTVIRLADVGVQPGDDVVLERFGEYLFSGTNPANTLNDVIAVFSRTDEILPKDTRARVPGALKAGDDVVTKRTFFGDLATDISEDFAVGGETALTVPVGAAYLFVAANDSEYQNNTDTDDDFRICVSQ